MKIAMRDHLCKMNKEHFKTCGFPRVFYLFSLKNAVVSAAKLFAFRLLIQSKWCGESMNFFFESA